MVNGCLQDNIVTKLVYVNLCMIVCCRKTDKAVCEQREHVMQLSKKSLTAEDSYTMSKAWFARFLTFAEPGPIDNTDLLCRHGQLIPGREAASATLLTFVPASVWHYLYNL